MQLQFSLSFKKLLLGMVIGPLLGLLGGLLLDEWVLGTLAGIPLGLVLGLLMHKLKLNLGPPQVTGMAYIIHSNPEQKMEMVQFDVAKPSFGHDGLEYDVKERGLFYGFMRFIDRLKKMVTAISFYDYGVREPKTFDNPLPTITAEILSMMAGETITGQGIKSLKSATRMKINWKWILIGIVGIVVVFVLLMFGPQIVEKLKGAI